MSANHKNTPGYQASDLEKYRRGELSAREMHALEAAAMDDPFLADALEGMEIHRSLRETASPGQHPEAPRMPAYDQDLEELHTRLNTRITRKDRKRIFFLPPGARVAAVLIGLLGLATITWLTLQKKHGSMEPLARTQPSATTAAPTTDSSIVATNSIPQTPAPVKTQPRAKNSEAKTRRVTKTPAPENDLAANAPADAEARVQLKKDTVIYSAQKFSKFSSNAPNLPLSMRYAFNGKVLGANNQPLAGASVFLKGNADKDNTDIGTVTDRQGRFSLEVHEKDSASKLTVAYVGYEQTSLDLNDLNRDNFHTNIIQLQPQRHSLDGVVVIGYGTQRKEKRIDATLGVGEKIDSLWLRATPVTGRLAYMDWLDTEKKRLPVDSTIKGPEIISFIVNKKGDLSAFKVEQSLSPAHDSSTIRLVREGPSWKLLRGREVRAAVRVNY
jgi:hypothetical protein